MSRLSELLAILGTSRDGLVPSSQIFPRLDVKQLARELRVQARGSRDGAAGIPGPDDSSGSSTETELRGYFQQLGAKALEDYRAQVELYDGRIRRGLLTADLRTSIEAAGEGVLSDFRAQATDDLNQLHLLAGEVRGRDAEFEAFRRVHQLTRLPRPQTHTLLRWLIVVLLALIESALNGVFFAEGSTAGLIGGISQAVVLSFLNIGFGLAFGRLLYPNINHASHLRKAFGVIAIVIYSLGVLILNLGIGHYRDLFVSNEGSVALSVLVDRIQAAPFGLSDARSLILVMLGICLSLAAVVDGATLSDPYPGYARVGRQRDDAISSYSDRRTRCIEDLRSTRDDAVKQMGQVISEVRARDNDISLALSGRRRLHSDFIGYQQHLNECYSALVQRYREANTTARSAPQPEVFASGPEDLSLETPPIPSGDAPANPDSASQLIARMEHFIKAIREDYDAQVDRYPSVAALLDRAASGATDA